MPAFARSLPRFLPVVLALPLALAGCAGGGESEYNSTDRADEVVSENANDKVAFDFFLAKGLTPVQAAAVPVGFLTGYVALFEAARARAGETALVLGAGGGVGTAAVQLAVSRGLKVIGTAGTPRKRDFVAKELGALACFDSRADWEEDVRTLVGDRGIDVALDSVGGRATRACRRLLAPLGRLVFYGLSNALPGAQRSWPQAAYAFVRTSWFHPRSLIEPNLGVFGIHLLHLKAREEILRKAGKEIFGEISAGKLRPVVDRTFPLTRDGAVEAHQYLHDRRNLGKVVLEAKD